MNKIMSTSMLIIKQNINRIIPGMINNKNNKGLKYLFSFFFLSNFI